MCGQILPKIPNLKLHENTPDAGHSLYADGQTSNESKRNM